MKTVEHLEEEMRESRGPAVTALLEGAQKYGPNPFVREIIKALGGRLNERQEAELVAALEDAAFWAEHDRDEDNSKDYFFCLAAGNLAKAEDSGDETDLEQAWRLYSRFNPYTGTKEGPTS